MESNSIFGYLKKKVDSYRVAIHWYGLKQVY